MFKSKNDPLVDSVKKIIQENDIRYSVEAQFNEELGITSKKALPHELHQEYDRVLAEAINEALKGNQHRIDVNNNNRVDAGDFKMLKAGVRKPAMEAKEYGVDTERDIADDEREYGVDKEREIAKKKYPKKAKTMEESEQLDELSPETLASYAIKANRYAKRAATWSGKDAAKYADKRNRGVKKAIDKLTDIAMSKKLEEAELQEGKKQGLKNKVFDPEALKSGEYKINPKYRHDDPTHNYPGKWNPGLRGTRAYGSDDDEVVRISTKGARQVNKKFANSSPEEIEKLRTQFRNTGKMDGIALYTPPKKSKKRLEEEDAYGDPEHHFYFMKNGTYKLADGKPHDPKRSRYTTKAKAAARNAKIESGDSGVKMDEETYSAKEARKGKDIGKPGKNFSMIAKSAGERYGSQEAGKRVAGAILKKLRAKNMEEETNLPLAEKTLTKAEMSKREELAKKMKKGDWSDRYGSRGKEVMYATATKMAKKLAENISIEDILEEIRANLGEEAFNALMEQPGTFAPGDNPENPNFGKGKTWGPVTGPQFDSGRTIPTAQVAQNLSQANAPASVVDAANKASVGPFLGRPDAPVSPNKPNLQQRQADIAKMAPATAAPKAPAPKTPAPNADDVAKMRAADAASMKNVNVADLNRIQKSDLSAFGKAFQTARSLQGIKSNQADPNAATGKNFSFKGKQYGVIRKDEK